MNKAVLLSHKDFELEKQLENISRKAQPKPILDQPIGIGKRPNYSRVLEGTPQYMAEKMLTDAMLDSQLEKISNVATQAIVSGPPKLVSAVTQEMIDEYKAESSKPIQINGVAYKYHPVNSLAAINLDQFDATPYNILTSEQVAQAYSDINDLGLQVKGFNEDIVLYEGRKEEARNRFDEQLPNVVKRDEKAFIKHFKEEIAIIDRFIQNDRNDIAALEANIGRI